MEVKKNNDFMVMADSVTNIKGKHYEYDATSREHLYLFDCMVNGTPTVLTYIKGQREFFQNSYSDYGEVDEVFSIHTADNDIWEQMNESELIKLESRLAGECALYHYQKKISDADTYDSLIDVYFEYMDDYDCPFSKEQRAIFLKMLCEKSNHIIEVEVFNAFSNEEIEQVLALLENAQSIMNEDDYDRISKMLIEKRKC